MTVSYVGQGGAVALATSATPTYPVVTAGDVLILWAASNASGVGTPSDGGWTELGSGANGGNVWARCWTKTATGSESGTLTITAAGTAGEAHISAYRGTGLTVSGGTFGTDTNTTSTAFSATGSSITTQTGDWIAESAVSRAPSGSYSSSNMTPGLAQSGATVSFTGRFSGRTGSNVLLYQHGDASVSSGGTGAPTVSGTTAGANAAGVAAFVVLREVASIDGSASGDGGSSGAVTPVTAAAAAGGGSIASTVTPTTSATAAAAGAVSAAVTPSVSGSVTGAGAAGAAVVVQAAGSAAGSGTASATTTAVVSGSSSGSGSSTADLDDGLIEGTSSGAGGASGSVRPAVSGSASATGGAAGVIVTAVLVVVGGDGAALGQLTPHLHGGASGDASSGGSIQVEVPPAVDITFSGAVGSPSWRPCAVTQSWTGRIGDPVKISVLSKEFVTARLDSYGANGSDAVVFDAQPVHLGLVMQGSSAQLSDFYPAEWVGVAGSRRWCRMLVGPDGGVSTYPPGDYDLYARVDDTSETAIRQMVGTVTFQ